MSGEAAPRVAIAWLLTLCACGGGPATEPATPVQTSGAERADERESGMEVSGLLGTIPEREVEAALEPKLGSFQRCFTRGAEQVEFIAGQMEFYFRVGADGAVEWVYPRSSTVGHRATEQCLLAAAKTARFPRPEGGNAAEVAWSFEIDPPEDVRAPVQWQAGDIASVLAEQRATLEGCGLPEGGLNITAYVARGGTVLAAGAAAQTRQAAEQIDCALGAIQSWPMPDPGSYPAKASFTAP
jgi:hypothetical protein